MKIPFQNLFKKKDASDAPMPKKYLFVTKKFFEKLPKKNTVSE